MAKTWLPDPSHYPEQMTPLSATVWFASMGRGLHEAMRELAGPFGGFETRTEPGWAYEGAVEPEWEHAPADALVRLHELQDGRRFLHELDAYLLRYGGRARWHELSLPREAESPQLTVESIRLLLEAPPPEKSQIALERERLEAETLARAPELRGVLEPVKAAAPLKETHTYFIDYPALLATREALLGFGRRLAAEGALAEPDDVWMLAVAELREAVLEWRPLHELVAARREELSR